MFKIENTKIGYLDADRRAYGQTFAEFEAPQSFQISADGVPDSLRLFFTACRDKEKKKFEITQSFDNNQLHIRFYNPSEGGWSGAIGRMATVRIGTVQLHFSFQMSVLPGASNYLLFYQFDEAVDAEQPTPTTEAK